MVGLGKFCNPYMYPTNLRLYFHGESKMMSFKVMNQDFVNLDEFETLLVGKTRWSSYSPWWRSFMCWTPTCSQFVNLSLNDIDALKEVGKKMNLCVEVACLNTLSDRLYIWSFHPQWLHQRTYGSKLVHIYDIWFWKTSWFVVWIIKQYQLRPNN